VAVHVGVGDAERSAISRDKVAWSDTNGTGVTRSFTRFSQAIDEIVDARVWSGIHFRTADEQGERIGEQVAQYRQEHYFQPGAASTGSTRSPPRLAGGRAAGRPPLTPDAA
jgi:hypothetical protein